MRLHFIAAAGLTLFCVFDGVAHAQQLRSVVHASGFSQPLAFVQSPTDRSVQFVVQQGGRIRVVQNGTVLGTDFLNLTGNISSGGERGLLSLAFPPDYASSGRLFVTFTDPNGNFVVSRFRRSTNPLVADGSSRFDLLLGGTTGYVFHPFTNHNGGQLAFGPDGFLYVGLGDGGSGNDPDHRAQNPADLLGKILRIDVSVPNENPAGYAIPPDNPFVDNLPVTARHEIWDFGLRNPWRFSFDDVSKGGTGALLIADVGQSAFEEVDFEPRGAGGRNYGWRNREGSHDNVTSRPPAFTPLSEPIFEYGRTEGQSITGGFVYRGSGLASSYRGRYFYADYVAGRIWSFALNQSNGVVTDIREHSNELGKTAIGNISSFGVDADGEIYVVNHTGGTILKIVPGHPSMPTNLRVIP